MLSAGFILALHNKNKRKLPLEPIVGIIFSLRSEKNVQTKSQDFSLQCRICRYSCRIGRIRSGVFAQDDEIEELVVTGSRLTRSNVTSSVPLVQTGSQETDSRGAARIADVVNILSSPDTGTGNNNPYPGLFDVSRFLFAGINYKF